MGRHIDKLVRWRSTPERCMVCLAGRAAYGAVCNARGVFVQYHLRWLLKFIIHVSKLRKRFRQNELAE